MNCCISEYPRGLLEGSRGQPRFGCQRGLRDTHELGTPSRWCATLGDDPTIFGFEGTSLNELTGQELRITGVDNRDALKHLTNDDLDVLIVN